MKKLYASLLSLACVATMSAVQPQAVNSGEQFNRFPVANNLKCEIIKSDNLAVSHKTTMAEDEWKLIGSGFFEDSYFSGEMVATDVYESTTTPGLYAFPDAWSQTGVANYEPFIIDCSTPGFVMVPAQNTGIEQKITYTQAGDFFTSRLFIASMSWALVNVSGVSPEDVEAYLPKYVLSLANNAVKLLEGTLVRNFPDAGDATISYSDGTTALIRDEWLAMGNPDMLVLFPGAEEVWKDSDYNGTWNDGILCPMYSVQSTNVTVTVQENNYYDGIYRIISPFQQLVGEGGIGGAPLVINVTNPKLGYIPMSGSGVEDPEDGEIYYLSASTFYITYQDMTEDAFLASYKDRNITASTDRGGNMVITCPGNCCFISWPESEDEEYNSNLYTVKNPQTATLRFLPGAAGAVESIEADNETPVYYNLQGVRVENPNNGIFIRRQGNKATKVML